MNPKIISMYLPQYHCIPENDEFWGKGYTDWVTVKKAQPIMPNHQQPHIPLNENYYDLSQVENVRWQAKLAKKYKIYGFGIYHYWFNNEKNLLTKPAEIIRDNKDIDINYFFTWDNGSWKRSWSNIIGNDWAPIQENSAEIKKGPPILVPYILGKEPDWEKHYRYVLTHFKEKRYIKIGNKPVFVIYRYHKELDAMCDYWTVLAKRDGFEGIYFIFRYDWKMKKNKVRFFYEPLHAAWENFSFPTRVFNKIKKMIGMKLSELHTYDYDKVWNSIIINAQKCTDKNIMFGAFVAYDDTPRRGENGKIIIGSTPEKFKKYMFELLEISRKKNKEFIFLTAWNEWGEGAYLEPDTINKYDYLNKIKEING